MKNIYLLGATGSIGTQVLEIAKKYPKQYKIITISGYNNVQRLKNIIEDFSPKFVACKDLDTMNILKNEYRDVEFGYGEEGLIKAATYNKEDKNGYLLNALVGSSGLVPTVEAIKINRNILLANKETLVMAGNYVMDLVKKHNVLFYPIDSEHSAIWQCLKCGKKKDVKRIIITASGGSFRDKTKEELENVTISDALNHPNWSMGKKITIDSATMMNKGFEVIEAHHLFDMPVSKIETIVHKESIIHSVVEYKDTSMVAVMNEHSMLVPISYAMSYPNRYKLPVKNLDLAELGSLHFEKMDFEKYPCLKLAYEAIGMGGLAPAVLNGANEAAVNLFLNGKIKFLDIYKIVKDSLNNFENIENPSIENIIDIDKKVQNEILSKYN